MMNKYITLSKDTILSLMAVEVADASEDVKEMLELDCSLCKLSLRVIIGRDRVVKQAR